MCSPSCLRLWSDSRAILMKGLPLDTSHALAKAYLLQPRHPRAATQHCISTRRRSATIGVQTQSPIPSPVQCSHPAVGQQLNFKTEDSILVPHQGSADSESRAFYNTQFLTLQCWQAARPAAALSWAGQRRGCTGGGAPVDRTCSPTPAPPWPQTPSSRGRARSSTPPLAA